MYGLRIKRILSDVTKNYQNEFYKIFKPLMNQLKSNYGLFFNVMYTDFKKGVDLLVVDNIIPEPENIIDYETKMLDDLEELQEELKTNRNDSDHWFLGIRQGFFPKYSPFIQNDDCDILMLKEKPNNSDLIWSMYNSNLKEDVLKWYDYLLDNMEYYFSNSDGLFWDFFSRDTKSKKLVQEQLNNTDKYEVMEIQLKECIYFADKLTRG